MKRTTILVAVAACTLLAAQAPETPEFYPLDQVKPGLTGVGRTIFQGTRIEEFQVEILGVLRNFSPQQNLILARLAGAGLEQTGVFAGMSGSPVYVDGKLVGAVAYSFPFSKDPIAGITPIREMVDIFEERAGTAAPIRSRPVPGARPVGQVPELSEFVSRLREASHPVFASGGGGRLQPIATPVSLSGFGPETLELFAEAFRHTGMVPVRGITSGEGDFEKTPLEAGSTVTVQLMRGDMEISAAGTATMVAGPRVYAFGHPFLGAGYTDMPLNQGAVLTVISSLQSSQKVTATTDRVGAIKQDRATGVLGVKGGEPRLLPIRLELHTSRKVEKTFRFEVITDPALTPFLTALAVFNSLNSSERTLGGQTLRVRSVISLANQPEVRFENSVADFANTTVTAALSASAPLGFLLSSGFDDLELEEVKIEIFAVEENRRAALEEVWVDRVEVEPGEELELTVFMRKASGETSSERYPLKIPEEITPGPLSILVGEGASVTKLEEDAGQEFVPRDLSLLVRAINNLKNNDRLYIRIYRDRAGAVVGGEGLPELPPSMLELYGSSRTAGDTKRIGKVIYVEHELPATSHVLSGHKTVQIQVTG